MLHVESVERLNQTAGLDISMADSLAGTPSANVQR
jgi:hypothetical protein